MPTFETTADYPAPAPAVFRLLRRSAVLALLAPPEMHLQLQDGPEKLTLGARLTLCGRRWGVPQRVVSEVTAFTEDALLVLEQRQGPFRRSIHTHRLHALPNGGTRLDERIHFEPPGGVLGLTVTAAFIERELAALFAFRRQKLAELLQGAN